MSMNLTPEDLELIADKVRQIDSLDLDVAALRVSGHDVYLKKEGGSSHVVGISNKQQGPGGSVMRGTTEDKKDQPGRRW